MGESIESGRPIKDLDIEFSWYGGATKKIFDKQVELIQQDVLRALAADRFVVYLSCPISSRGGSFHDTNVEVAEATARRLTMEWGDRFWFLNPGQYQMESHQGAELIARHAKAVARDARDMKESGQGGDPPTPMPKPNGGDYLRMWTRVLVEDGGRNLGERISAFYFMGPSDCRQFFTEGGQKSVASGVEAYFARKFTFSPAFRKQFSEPFLDAEGKPVPDQAAEAELRRKDFLRYYTIRGSAAFSRGSHDEWNLWVALNKLRLADPKLGVGQQIPGFFDGNQVDLATAESRTTAGYALASPPAAANTR